MSIRWRPHSTDPLMVLVSAFHDREEPYTVDFGNGDVRSMRPGGSATKAYPAAGSYRVLARTVHSGVTAEDTIVVRSYLTPRFSVEALSARRVRVRVDHPGDPVILRVNWGDDNTWSDHGADELELEYVYPRTETPPVITVLDAPARRSARKQAPVARDQRSGELIVRVDGVLRVRPDWSGVHGDHID